MEHQTIIVGSGVAASALTKRILEADSNHSVLVLEAGPRVPQKDRRAWWDYVIHGRTAYDHCHDLPLPGQKVSDAENESTGPTEWVFRESRMMGVGGSTYHWGGWGLRFKPEDFKLFSATQRGADWPIDYDDMKPYYYEAEVLLSVSGADPHNWTPRDGQPYPLPPFEATAADAPMIAAFDKLGIRHAPMPVARYRKCMTTGTCKYCPIGARFAASQLLDQLKEGGRSPNLQIQERCSVSELLLDQKDHVIGVRYLDCVSGRTREAYGQRVVICTGSYESPKLLLRSRQFWEHGVGNDKKLVGRHIISHPFLYVRGMSTSNPMKLQQELDFPTLMSRHYDTPEQQRDGKLFLFRDRTKPRVDLAGLMKAGKTKAQIETAVTGPVEWELQGLMEEFSNPDNRVELGNGLNHLGLPQTRIRFDRAEGFREAANERLGWMKKVLQEMELKVGKTEGKDFGVLTQRGDHAASTCRMADSPEDGVVDKNLQVHGVKNLFVCSNAVFPSGAAVNPTLTVTALSLRLGELLSRMK